MLQRLIEITWTWAEWRSRGRVAIAAVYPNVLPCEDYEQ
jgi:hypothetical protein